ncbi:hypothetical protein NP493_87g05021 [Ridgeia piscesae]|uniref:Uncharacterized protein n=1 Tax=Ridgeia piscesae TaxID=27915 RepID=A0AAD9P8N4_RIDPI|nr:hypothetical protein NP493_87g05021 [Ridgeia piscesae]
MVMVSTKVIRRKPHSAITVLLSGSTKPSKPYGNLYVSDLSGIASGVRNQTLLNADQNDSSVVSIGTNGSWLYFVNGLMRAIAANMLASQI